MWGGETAPAGGWEERDSGRGGTALPGTIDNGDT